MRHPEHAQEMHADDTAPGDERPGREDLTQGVVSYVIGIALASILTVLSFTTAKTHLVWMPSIPVALFVLAVAQIGIHIVFFLHITSGPDSINNVMALAFGVLIVFLLIAGSVWIMDHLNHAMVPMDTLMNMQR